MALLFFAIITAAFVAVAVIVLDAYQPKNLRQKQKYLSRYSPLKKKRNQVRNEFRFWVGGVRAFIFPRALRRGNSLKPETRTMLYAMCGGDRELAQRLANSATGYSLQEQWEHAIAQLARDRR